MEIPAIYYKPLTATSKNKVPAMVDVHGGPGGQSRLGYSSFIQFLVNHGYAVLSVNNRGSSGYGKTFNKMDDRNHGDKDLKDCIWGKKWLQSPGLYRYCKNWHHRRKLWRIHDNGCHDLCSK